MLAGVVQSPMRLSPVRHPAARQGAAALRAAAHGRGGVHHPRPAEAESARPIITHRPRPTRRAPGTPTRSASSSTHVTAPSGWRPRGSRWTWRWTRAPAALRRAGAGAPSCARWTGGRAGAGRSCTSTRRRWPPPCRSGASGSSGAEPRPGEVLVWDLARVERGRHRARRGGRAGPAPHGARAAAGAGRALRRPRHRGGRPRRHRRPGRRQRRHPPLRDDLGAQVEPRPRPPPRRARCGTVLAPGDVVLVRVLPGKVDAGGAGPRRQAAGAGAGAAPPGAGRAGGHRPGHARRAGAGGRLRLRDLPVQPCPPGEAAARQRHEALRVGGGHRVAPLHARPRWSTTPPTSTATPGPARSGSRRTSSATSTTAPCCWARPWPTPRTPCR